MPISSLFRRNPIRVKSYEAYGQVVAQARSPGFFLALEVPDTLDGRFELIALHVFLVLNRLKAEHDRTAVFGQAVFDAMFADLDRGLREMGAGDLGVGRRVKAMATGFYGRVVAYEQGLAGSDGALGEALTRNLYGTVVPGPDAVAGMVRYIHGQVAALGGVPIDDLLSGNIRFGSLAIEK